MASESQYDGSQTGVDFTAQRVHHLEFIQGVVNRLAGNSAIMKRYCIALVAVGAGTYKAVGETQAVPALIVIVAAFWWLDARYLEEEKRFRDLYNHVRAEPIEQRPDFRLTPEASKGFKSLLDCIWNWSTASLYLPLVGLLFVLWLTL